MNGARDVGGGLIGRHNKLAVALGRLFHLLNMRLARPLADSLE
jgi:hypothetical protein